MKKCSIGENTQQCERALYACVRIRGEAKYSIWVGDLLCVVSWLHIKVCYCILYGRPLIGSEWCIPSCSGKINIMMSGCPLDQNTHTKAWGSQCEIKGGRIYNSGCETHLKTGWVGWALMGFVKLFACGQASCPGVTVLLSLFMPKIYILLFLCQFHKCTFTVHLVMMSQYLLFKVILIKDSERKWLCMWF